MANRYYVGGVTGTWDTLDRTDWASSSGGAGGASAPTAADDVIFDANSNQSAQVSLGVGVGDASCRSLTTTGWAGGLIIGTGILLVGDGTIGNITFGASTQIHAGAGGGEIRLVSTAGASGYNTISMNGVQIPANLTVKISGANGKWKFGDAFVCGSPFVITTGILNLDGQNFTAFSLSSAAGNAKELYLREGTTTLTGTGTVLDLATDAADLTVDAGTSTIVVSDSSSSAKTINSGGKTLYNLTVSSGGSGVVTINSATGTFNTITLNGPKTVKFTNGITTTISGLTVSGGVVISSDSAGNTFTLSKSSGTVSISGGSLQDSTASGGATFRAHNTQNISNNTGWTFTNSGMIQFFDI